MKKDNRMVSGEGAVGQGLKAVADETRRSILTLLRDGEKSVLEIAEEFPMSRPAISKHLRILKEAGLVVETPAGRQRIYTLDETPLAAIGAWLAQFGADQARPGSGGRGEVAIARSTEWAPARTHPRPADRNGWRVW